MSEYAKYEFVGAKSVIADYYGVPTVSLTPSRCPISLEAGVSTADQIRRPPRAAH